MYEITQKSQAKAVIRAVLALGHSFSISVLAEGVETNEQLAFLNEEGCDEAQSFLLGDSSVESTLDSHTPTVL